MFLREKRFADMLSRKYDVMVTQFQYANKYLAEAKRLKIPSVFIAHNDMVTTTSTLSRYKPSLVIYNTQWLKQSLEEKLGRTFNSTVLHPPVYREEHATKPGGRITLVNLIPSKGGICVL